MPISSQSGFSLPLALLVVGALAGAALLATSAARGHLRGAAAATGQAQAEAIADAGVALALLELDRTRAARLQPGSLATTRHHACRIDGTALRLITQDEGGKIDLNFADARLLTALFVGLGEARPRAQALADAIIDFRDADDDARPFGAERDAYLEAGRTAGPKNARFADIAEVRAVLGMTQAIADRMEPFVTVHSARDGIDPTVADKALIALLARGDAEAGFTAPDSGEAQSLTAGDTPLPAPFVQPSLHRFYTITAEAAMPHARFVRETIVDSGAPAVAGTGSSHIVTRYRFWSWRRGNSGGPQYDPAVPLTSWSPC